MTEAAPLSAATTMADLKRVAEAKDPATAPLVRAGFDTLPGFLFLQRAASMLAASSVVPEAFQGNPANCAIALEMAQRLDASVLMVLQNIVVIHGRPTWSAKFLVASFNQGGRFGEMKFEWSGERGADSWGCRAWATEKATGERVQGPECTIKIAKDEGWYARKGSKWPTLPELMLMYRAATWLVSTNAPEVSMGLPTQEEVEDGILPAQRGADGAYSVTLETLRDPPPANNPPEPPPEPPPAASPPPKAPPPAGALEKRLRQAKSVHALDDAAEGINFLPEDERARVGALYNELRDALEAPPA